MSNRPDWDRLYEVASAQDGHFTTAQAAEAGYYPQLLAKYLRSSKIRRVRRGIYRIVHYPACEREDLAVLWLWSKHSGVFGHETALALHDLSDALPSKIHMTLPSSWKSRRLRVPRPLVLHHADIPNREWHWSGSVPVTSPASTLIDCAKAEIPPDLLRQAVREGLDRGLFAHGEIAKVEHHLALFEAAAR